LDAQIIFASEAGRRKMRACFLGQNICNLGFGVAILQAPRLVMDEPVRPPSEAELHDSPTDEKAVSSALIGSRSVAIPPLADA
jgi:hypothetical protein